MTSNQYIETHPSHEPRLRFPFIIAEAGVNHEGDMDIARRLVDEAAEGGAHAIKFQSYKADTLASKNSPAYWDTTKETTLSQYELFRKYDTFWKEEFEALKSYCDEVGIEFLSTPFDLESATFLNDLMHSFKISSSDLTNLPFIEHICQYGKPILLSTGAAYLWEIQEAVDLIERHGVDYCLMHCILNYPTRDENANLGMIHTLKSKFPGRVIGYSDHTMPNDMEVCRTAVLLGASMLEKHFTHDKTLPGNDHYHAMDLDDLRRFRHKLDELFTYVGSFEKRPLESEQISRRNARRSLVAAGEIRAGQVITEAMLAWKRPAFGISPRHFREVVGMKARQDIQKDAILYWDMLRRKEN